MFIFGLTADEVLNYYKNGVYNLRDIYNTDERVRIVLEQLNRGEFCEYVIKGF
ncbi:glycogen/starch/alpha-glucan phosphorylase [Fervidibacillus halotolerans]|uniref:Glycogen/starch/alpha-glucan phosphorylase n=1 Tax=Fervidibacillus halotolerans TaxID=2980027 RepID=A0A9E8M0F1_9BACI|nr:glycogen/starch/alpha-glucan phosphorylase [Fervidibacillus halotolerans]WAA13178.1 glycogen/starch/alpha-glucan phosphorylase [Fervidibacillus halotolerans]